MDDTRRWLLSGGVALTAGAVGAALSWQHWKPSQATPEAVSSVWQHRFQDVQGQTVGLNAWIHRPLLLNFWATWCPPCVEEMPMLDTFYRAHAQTCTIVGLAVDRIATVRRFVEERGIGYPILLAGTHGLNLAKDLGNDAGGLPFSAFFDKNGLLLRVKVGQLSESDLTSWL
jgi:thiol-disulfide isomerase/thioredoxin